MCIPMRATTARLFSLRLVAKTVSGNSPLHVRIRHPTDYQWHIIFIEEYGSECENCTRCAIQGACRMAVTTVMEVLVRW